MYNLDARKNVTFFYLLQLCCFVPMVTFSGTSRKIDNYCYDNSFLNSPAYRKIFLENVGFDYLLSHRIVSLYCALGKSIPPLFSCCAVSGSIDTLREGGGGSTNFGRLSRLKSVDTAKISEFTERKCVLAYLAITVESLVIALTLFVQW